MNKCVECLSTHLIMDYKRAEIVCNDCGAVNEESLLFNEPTEISYDTHGPAYNRNLHDGGISTIICEKNIDSQGKRLTREASNRFFRLRRWQKKFRIRGSIEKNLSISLRKIAIYGSNLELNSSIIETASLFFKKAVSRKILRGRSVDWIISAVLYAACREHGNPVTLKEISKITEVSKQDIGKTFRNINRFLELKIQSAPYDMFLSRYCSQLDLPSAVISSAREILQKAYNMGFTAGKNIQGLAAAVIYIACKQNNVIKTQKQISDVTGVTQITIRNRYKEIERECL